MESSVALSPGQASEEKEVSSEPSGVAAEEAPAKLQGGRGRRPSAEVKYGFRQPTPNKKELKDESDDIFDEGTNAFLHFVDYQRKRMHPNAIYDDDMSVIDDLLYLSSSSDKGNARGTCPPNSQFRGAEEVCKQQIPDPLKKKGWSSKKKKGSGVLKLKEVDDRSTDAKGSSIYTTDGQFEEPKSKARGKQLVAASESENDDNDDDIEKMKDVEEPKASSKSLQGAAACDALRTLMESYGCLGDEEADNSDEKGITYPPNSQFGEHKTSNKRRRQVNKKGKKHFTKKNEEQDKYNDVEGRRKVRKKRSSRSINKRTVQMEPTPTPGSRSVISCTSNEEINEEEDMPPAGHTAFNRSAAKRRRSLK